MVRYIKPIDPHVHLRGEEYPTNYLELGFKDARAVGLAGLLEQPNPKPQLTSIDKIMTRLTEARRYSNGIHHSVHIGLTTDLTQVEHALGCVMSEEGIVADKTFYVHSTGNMGILDPELQRRIWVIKGKLGYTGVSIGHFEDEGEFSSVKFNPSQPFTHSVRQTAKAELVQVQKQIRNAVDANFTGVFYVAHVSNPDTVDYIEAENKVKKTIKIDKAMVIGKTTLIVFVNPLFNLFPLNLEKIGKSTVEKAKREAAAPVR